MRSVGWRKLAMVVVFAGTFAVRFWWPVPTSTPLPEVVVSHAASAGEKLNQASAPSVPDVAGESWTLAASDLRSASVERVRERLESLKTLYPPSRRELMRGLLIGRWLELDPAGAFAWCRDDWTAHPYSGNIVSLLRQWSELDPDAAISAWQSMPEGARRDRLIPGLLWGFMEREPDTYLHYLEKFPPDSIRFPAGVAKIFDELAQDDRTAAMERVSTLPENLRAQAYAGITSGWIKQDPTAALEWVRAMAGGATRDDCLNAVLDSDWAPGHPDDAGALFPLLSNQSGLDGNSTVLSIFRSLRDTDPIAAGAWAIKYLKAGDSDSLIEAELIPQALHDAPETLAGLLTSLAEADGNPESAQWWLGSHGYGGIESGHGEVFAMLAGIEDTAIRQSALRGVLYSGTWNFDEAAAALNLLPASDRDALLPSLAGSAMPGLDDAAKRAKLLGFAGQMPPGGQRNALIASLIGGLVSGSGQWDAGYPKDAAQLLASYPEAAGAGSSTLIADIADSWYGQADGDTGDLLAWASMLESRDQRQQAWGSIAKNLAKTDAAAASEWISTLPASDPTRDRTVAAFAEAIATNDADAALVWAQSIAAPAVREATLNSVIDQLTWDNPAAARQAVSAAPIEETSRRALLYRIDHP